MKQFLMTNGRHILPNSNKVKNLLDVSRTTSWIALFAFPFVSSASSVTHLMVLEHATKVKQLTMNLSSVCACIYVCVKYVPFYNDICICKTEQGGLNTDYHDPRSFCSHGILVDVTEHISSRNSSKGFCSWSNWDENNLCKRYPYLQQPCISLNAPQLANNIITPVQFSSKRVWFAYSHLFLGIFFFSSYVNYHQQN